MSKLRATTIFKIFRTTSWYLYSQNWAVTTRGEQKTDLKPNRNRNREKPGKTEPSKTETETETEKIKPNRFSWFGSGYIAKPNRKKPNRTDY